MTTSFGVGIFHDSMPVQILGRECIHVSRNNAYYIFEDLLFPVLPVAAANMKPPRSVRWLI
ncbi:hypothetical protein BST43_12295 [Mycobacteroides saopaulense]|uniref:Uncharacterized protein n=1 Tax=Mycobacteroides saopaulense TaxID=1578165 RepID=A0A1X0J7C9_9MYCO|nr:hypothetical protein BST43_12295 [Mycobacteroides saopaulense]